MDFKNITYSHEHMVIDLSKQKNNEDCYLNVYEEALDELYDLKNKGVTRIVDCSNRGMGVDWEICRKIEAETGIEILLSTGYYKDPFYPDEVRENTVEELADIMLDELNNGATLIGEIGTSKDEMTDSERKVFEAAVIAHKKSNAVILTHTTLGTYAREQIDFFKSHDVNLNKVILSHCALADDYELLLDLAESGVYLAFDTIGKLNYLSDERHIEFILGLVDAGYSDQILMSMDLTRKSHLLKNGGNGFAYLLDTFVPRLLANGMDSNVLSKILSANFSRVLGG